MFRFDSVDERMLTRQSLLLRALVCRQIETLQKVEVVRRQAMLSCTFDEQTDVAQRGLTPAADFDRAHQVRENCVSLTTKNLFTDFRDTRHVWVHTAVANLLNHRILFGRLHSSHDPAAQRLL